MSIKLGLKIVINNEEKDLDDIFLKISDYNANSSNYQSGEAVQLTQNTGIKYIDEFGVKRDLIERYIGYDTDGYIADNYETDPNRIDASNLNAITEINDNNLVNFFYQLGTKKVSSNEYKSYIIHNKSKEVRFDMKFLQEKRLYIRLLYRSNFIQMKLNNSNIIITINGTSVIINTLSISSTIDIQNIQTSDISSYSVKFIIDGSEYINKDSGNTIENFSFDKDTV